MLILCASKILSYNLFLINYNHKFDAGLNLNSQNKID